MIIYTCPKCGSDLEDYVIATYPPKQMKRCTNAQCGWSYVEGDDIIRIPYTPPKNSSLPECCRNCGNRPKDGETKFCHCVLPYMTTTGDVISYGVSSEVMFGGET